MHWGCLLPVGLRPATWSTDGLAGLQPASAFYRPGGCWALQTSKLGCPRMRDLTLAGPGKGDTSVKGNQEHFISSLFFPSENYSLEENSALSWALGTARDWGYSLPSDSLF